MTIDLEISVYFERLFFDESIVLSPSCTLVFRFQKIMLTIASIPFYKMTIKFLTNGIVCIFFVNNCGILITRSCRDVDFDEEKLLELVK